jgi:hypothetical protein
MTSQSTQWTGDELKRIGQADELRIAGLREDGTLHKPVIIWVVRVGDDLYVRSYKGQAARWYQGTRLRHAGRIWAGGIEKDVDFVDEPDPQLNDRVDAAYLAKYGHTPYAQPMLAPAVRATTIRLAPRAAGG